jgi:hypothetical protein
MRYQTALRPDMVVVMFFGRSETEKQAEKRIDREQNGYIIHAPGQPRRIESWE